MLNELQTKNLILSHLASTDISFVENFELRNQEHWAKWESPQEEIQKRFEHWLKEGEEGRAVRLFMRSKEDQQHIIGACNFTQIFYGPFKACSLGYKIDARHEGKGLMREALETLIPHVFDTLGIHRIMSNYMPCNVRSAKLLTRLGFSIEGYAKDYLLINNKWEDHVLTALCQEQWRSRRQNSDGEIYSAHDTIFRQIRMDDAQSLVDLLEQLGYPIHIQVMKENIEKYTLLFNQKAWVAEREGKVVGCIAVALTNYFHRQGTFLRVITMIVDKNQRRTGLGKSLMGLAEKFASEHQCTHIELTSGVRKGELGSHEFYRSLGYSELNDIQKYFAKKLY